MNTERPASFGGRAGTSRGAQVPSFTTTIQVEWEDCDPAGIIFYPRFYAYFDRGTWNLWHSIGLDRGTIQALGAVGFPIAEAQARFLHPCRFRDLLSLESKVTEIKDDKWITVSHTIHMRERLVVSGYELRFFGVAHPGDPARLRAGTIPAELLAKIR